MSTDLEAFAAGVPGVYADVPAETYFALPACSASALKQFARSPLHCKEAMDNPTEPTPAMVLGTAVHTAVLQPELFAGLYVLAQRCSATKKDGAPCANPGRAVVGGKWLCGVHLKMDRHAAAFAAIHEKLSADGFRLTHVSDGGSRYYANPSDGRLARVSDHAPGARGLRRMLVERRESFRVDLPPHGSDDPRTILSPDQWAACEGMRDAVHAHPAAARALKAGDAHRELSVLWVDRSTGVLCKLRADQIGGGVAWDLKTTVDASNNEFAWTIRRRKYDLQGAFYLRGLAAAGIPLDGFGFIAVESERPHGIGVYTLVDEDLAEADEDIFGDDGLLARYAECAASGRWGGYSDQLRVLKLPPKRSAVVEV